jgi:hypothetical protein
MWRFLLNEPGIHGPGPIPGWELRGKLNLEVLQPSQKNAGPSVLASRLEQIAANGLERNGFARVPV